MDALVSMGNTSVAVGSLSNELSKEESFAALEETTTDTVVDMSDLQKQKLAKDFESLLLTRLFETVKESINASSFDEDAGSDQVHGMFWSFLAEDMADKGGFGLWQEFYQQFKGMDGTGGTGQLVDKEL